MQKKPAMKKLFIIFAMLIALLPVFCKKTGSDTTAALALIRHKWMLVSHNGEALRYVGTAGDYYDFNVNNLLYEYAAQTYDTLAYKLQADNKTLVMYPITNGIKSTVPVNYTIKVLDSSHFVLGNFGSVVFSLDSLKR
jgi:hypothetical protein